MMRRLPSALSSAPLVAVVGARPFSSEYGSNVGKMKPSHKFNSRSAAHRHPPRQTTWKSKDTAAPVAATPDTTPVAIAEDNTELQNVDASAADEEIPRRVKSRYQSYFESRSEPITFTSTFSSGARPQDEAMEASVDKIEDTVAKLYSAEEVEQMSQQQSARASAASTRGKPAARQRLQQAVAPNVDALKAQDDDATDLADVDADETSGVDTFEAVRSHPYFSELVRRTDTNMGRYRKELRATGRYSRGAVDDCIRPLLQLVDYPFTASELHELANSVSPIVLRNSLKEPRNCRTLHIYHSKETDVLLDWTVEDFLRRRYESIHVSWEPLDVVRKRFGWSPDAVTDRDCLLYLSEFTDFVELGELRTTAKGNLKAIPIDDPVALALSDEDLPRGARLLVRRVAQPETEPSVTETIRLMGTPALERRGGGGRPANRAAAASRRHHNPTSVSDVFESAEEAAAEVDGDEAAKLQHAARAVKPLRQASHPSGRVIKAFSLGRRLTDEEAKAALVAETPESAPTATATTEAAAAATFDAASYEALSSAYHKAKVESSVLRRQLLSTDNMEMVARLEAKLAGCRREMRRLEGQLMNTIHQGHPATDDISPEGTDVVSSTPPANDAGDRAMGFRLPPSLPQYAEAPEFDAEPPKNRYGAAEPDLDEDEIERAIQDFDAEVSGLHSHAAPTSTTYHRIRQAPPARAAAVEEAEMDVIQETVEAVDAEDDEATLPPPTAADTTSLVEETAEYQAMLRDKQAHEARMAKMASQLAAMEKRLAEAAAAEEKRAADEAAQRQAAAKARAEKARAQLEARKQAELEAREQAELEAREQAEREAREQAEREARHERARLREIAARKAEAQRRRAEEEALALEAELERKLAEVRAKLQHASAAAVDAVDADEDAIAARDAAGADDLNAAELGAADTLEDTATAAVADEDEREHETPTAPMAATQASAAPSPSTTTTTTTTVSNGFTCSPEQYDGLQLAATRLRREIATLEAQMEEEGDEDDETLMTVLAASRADLEELDECIHSVQAHEEWAAARDARRLAEEQRANEEEDTEVRRVQREVDQHRFNVELLNRRIQHATSRPVISALEQRVVQARREIARLRVSQDRLLREGRDTFGLPREVSMAKSLAGELKDSEATELAEEVKRAAAGLPPSPSRADDADGEPRATSETTSTENDRTAETTHTRKRGETAPARSEPKIVQENPEMRQLRQRLDGILRSIQNVQEGLLRMRDAPAAYDEEEEEAALADMKDKLGQLLALRDDILSRLKETAASANGADTANEDEEASLSSTDDTSRRGQPLPVLRSATADKAAAGHVLASPKSHTVPSNAPQKHRFQSAHKKVNASARLRKSRS